MKDDKFTTLRDDVRLIYQAHLQLHAEIAALKEELKALTEAKHDG